MSKPNQLSADQTSPENEISSGDQTMKLIAQQNKILEEILSSNKSSTSVDLAFTTSLAAIVLVLANTLGSGSYLDYLETDRLKEVVTTFAYIVTIMFGFAFSTSLYAFILRSLSIKMPKKDVSILKKLYKFLFVVSISLLAFLIISVGDAFLFRDPDDTDIINIIGLLALYSAMIAALATVAYFIYDMIRTDFAGFIIVSIIFISTGLVWINQYRDAKKAAFVTDSQYCYWLSTGSSDYSTDPTCTKQQGDKIEHRFYRSAPYAPQPSEDRIENTDN